MTGISSTPDAAQAALAASTRASLTQVADPVGPIDVARARSDARTALSQIDFSKRQIVIYVPGTKHHDMPSSFADAIRGAFDVQTLSLSVMDYISSWDLPNSQPTGELTLRLLLAAIAAHPGDHQVFLAGESQGAWIIGDALANPSLAQAVSGAVLFGHPSVALHHYPDTPGARVLEFNNDGDPIAHPGKGKRRDHVDAISALYTGRWMQRLGLIAKVVAMNPLLGTRVIARAMRSAGVLPKASTNPHSYVLHHAAAARHLRSLAK